jgi:hypothetical protein
MLIFISFFSFLFSNHYSILAWRGMGGLHNEFLACGRFWQKRKMHMAFEGYSANGLLFFCDV